MTKRSKNPRRPSAIKRAEEYVRAAQANVQRLEQRRAPVVRAPQVQAVQTSQVMAHGRGGGQRRTSR